MPYRGTFGHLSLADQVWIAQELIESAFDLPGVLPRIQARHPEISRDSLKGFMGKIQRAIRKGHPGQEDPTLILIFRHLQQQGTIPRL